MQSLLLFRSLRSLVQSDIAALRAGHRAVMTESVQAKTCCNSGVIETSSGVTDAEFDMEVLREVRS